MIDHYNAFISYKHGELDSKIAERVQHKLEHFHIPGKIAKRTGVKKITRIFRDKEELPITSNLTDTISYALEHSDYLIVICSTRTKLSTWVTREIKVFLETHPRNRVLTVLCDGEPGDVIPEELLYEEHEVTDENGTVHKVKVPLEPLSCDYRMSFRKADKEELPRLAAPIVGCSYDELMRRRRVYRIQRAAAIGSVVLAAAVGFGFYSFQKKREIQQHYEDALRSHAHYLASESLRLYNEEERVKSLQLALASLPSEDNPDIPVTSAGIRAITKATEAYVPLLSSLTYMPEWNYSLPCDIKNMKVSPEGYYLAASDEVGNLKCWDTYSHRETFSYQGSANYGFPNEDILIILTKEKMFAVSTEGGKVIWENIPEKKSKDNKIASFTDYSDEFRYEMLEFRDGYIYSMLGDGSLIKIDVNTGERVYTSDFEDSPTAKYLAVIDQASISPDGTKVALAFENAAAMEYYLVVYDFETSQFMQSETVYDSELALTWCGNDNILISTLDNFLGSGTFNGILTEHTIYLANYDPETCKEKWKNEYHYYANYGMEGGFFHPEGSDTVSYCIGKNMANINIENGEISNSFVCSADIVCVFDDAGDGNAKVITADGKYGITGSSSRNGDYVSCYRFSSNDFSDAIVNFGIYTTNPGDNEITCYRNDVYDRNWNGIGTHKSKETDLGLSLNKYVYGDTLLIESYDPIKNPVDDYNTQHYTLTVIDQNAGEVIDKFNLDGSFFDYYGLIKVDNYCYIFSNVNDDPKILKFDLDKGKVVDEFDIDAQNLFASTVFRDVEKFWYRVSVEQEGYLISFDPVTEKFKEYDMGSSFTDIDYSFNMCFTDDGKKVMFGTCDGMVHILDTDTGDIDDIEIENGKEFKTAYMNNDCICLANAEIVKVLSLKDYEEMCSIDCGELGPYSFYEKDGILYIVFESDLLGKYKTDDGSLLAITEINFEFDSQDADFLIYNDKLLIDNHYAATVIDTNEFVQTGIIYYFLSYHEGTNRYYDYSNYRSKGYNIGYYDIYTTEDLIQKAQDMLDGAELSDEDKARYGI